MINSNDVARMVSLIRATNFPINSGVIFGWDIFYVISGVVVIDEGAPTG
jgi:hypothetical protein